MVARGQLEGEQVQQADPVQARVAVAHRGQWHLRGEPLQGVDAVRVMLDLTACGEICLERRWHQCHVIPRVAQHAFERDQSLRSEIMRQVGMFGVDRIAQHAAGRFRPAGGGGRCVREQPRIQRKSPAKGASV